jgi:tRNA-2-methylthio-N6-dimethylallyladenosine synthase
LSEIIDLQGELSTEQNRKKIGTVQKVLIDGYSKRSPEFFKGRTDDNTTAVFPKEDKKIGDYVLVKINNSSRGSLFGEIIASSEERNEITLLL